MKTKNLLWAIPTLAVVGCVNTHQPVTYSTLPPEPVVATAPGADAVIVPGDSVTVDAAVVPTPPPTPTSVGSEVRVYPEPKLSITTAVPPPVTTRTVPGVIVSSDPRDIGITQDIRKMLTADTATLYRNVDFSIDNGKVSLRGTVPTDHDRVELQNRMMAIPGVQTVDNKLDVELR